MILNLIDENKASAMLEKYYSVLRNTGYVKHGIVNKFLAYLFLIDFVHYSDEFITEDDYKMIESAMRLIFTDGGCMLPYPTYCTNRAKLMDNRYHGAESRITEDTILRSIEEVKLRSMKL